jgi:UDP-glucose 4-epimerase
MKLDDAHVLVTGGCGLIGSATVDLLLKHPVGQVTVLDNLVRGRLSHLNQAFKDKRVRWIHADIRDREAVSRAMNGVDGVIHLAALRITACAAEPREALQVMCDGSFNVIDEAHQAQVRKVVVASSASVYGQADLFPTTESHHPWNNDTWYGACKVMLEGLLKSYHAMHGLPGLALRYFNVYGPRMDTHGKYTEVLVRWMERIAAGQPPIIEGTGQQTLDFVYIDDVARANVLALSSELTTGVFNVGSGQETSLKELAQTLLKVMKSPLQPTHTEPRHISAVSRRWADMRHAEKDLNFSAQVGLSDGLARLVEWWHAAREDQSIEMAVA